MEKFIEEQQKRLINFNQAEKELIITLMELAWLKGGQEVRKEVLEHISKWGVK